MYYYSIYQKPKYHQMTLDEFLSEKDSRSYMITNNSANTRTYCMKYISDKLLSDFDVEFLINRLKIFNDKTEYLRKADRESLYETFYIPKKSGKSFRRIDAPNEDLKNALRFLKSIFEKDFRALYHTSAFAYIKHRSTIDAVKRHQSNNSRWFGKYDLSNFFGSTTIDFVMQMFSMIFPFCMVLENEEGKKEFKKAIELAFLNGGLPQGTPISPLITNIMMIPIDFRLSNELYDYNRQKYVYTRYADDFLISSQYNFDYKMIEKIINDALREFNAPFSINSSKTRYGSSSGSNWNLGVMLNKENKITIGYKKKRQFEAILTNYIAEKKLGKTPDPDKARYIEGLRSYYYMVEGDSISRLIDHINNKHNVNVIEMLKKDIHN